MKYLACAIALSLGLNLVFLVTFVRRPDAAPAMVRGWLSGGEAGDTDGDGTRNGARRAGDPAVAARKPSLWQLLATDDLPTLVARLRAAGFPAAVIRSIVSVRLDGMFSARLAAFRQQVDETPFWQPAPNMTRSAKWMEEQQQVFRERARLQRELLGDSFFLQSGEVTAAQRRQFGDLPKGKIDQIQQINDDYAEMISQIRAGTQGILLAEDREKIAYLEREKRADLARVLSTAELEEYEMRNASTTALLRTAMALMNANDQEFRAVYAIRKPFDDEFNPMTPTAQRIDFNVRRQREEEVNRQIRQALGEARGAEFERVSNYEYQQLAQIALREGLPAGSAVKAFEIRDAAAAESKRIGDDRALTNEQKLTAMKALAEKTKVDLTATMGRAGATYADSAHWLQAIGRGTIVEFRGSATMYRGSFSTPAPGPAGTGATPTSTPKR